MGPWKDQNTGWARAVLQTQGPRSGAFYRNIIGYSFTKCLVNGRKSSAMEVLFLPFFGILSRLDRMCTARYLSRKPKRVSPASTIHLNDFSHWCRMSSCASGIVSIHLGLVGGNTQIPCRISPEISRGGFLQVVV